MTEEEEVERAKAKQRYEFFMKNHVNNSESAIKLLERIKEGYDPNQADVFELMNQNQNEIDNYRKIYDLKERVAAGVVSKEDFEYLIEKVGFEKRYADGLRSGFEINNLIVDEYDKKQR